MKGSPEYSLLDKQPMLAHYLLFPRSDHTPPPDGAYDLSFAVGEDEVAKVNCRFYPKDSDWPWLLYFHGNGEVAPDYDYIYKMYHNSKLNLVVADYRGYGKSSGVPTFENLVKDAHQIFPQVKEELARRGYNPDLWVMGRSLGSMPALDLAALRQGEIRGLIIESGFASAVRLVKRWGLPADLDKLLPLEEQCLDMIGSIHLPALVMHGERDSLVAVEEGRLLFDTLGSKEKRWLPIAEADHNDIMLVDSKRYFEAIRDMVYDFSRG